MIKTQIFSSIYKLQIKYQLQGNLIGEPMSDKTKLIESMSNLIQHVSFSRRNQQQIFSTLSATDIKKILSNLQDSNEKLRKTTLFLLAELLYDNSNLQKKFCQLTGIPQYSAKVVLSSHFPKSILADTQSLAEVVKLLKDKNKESKQNALFWYIDSYSKPKILQYGNRNLMNVDPLNCIVGVWIFKQGSSEKQKSISSSIPLKQYKFSPIQNQQKINGKYMANPANSANNKVRLNRSQLCDKQKQQQTVTDDINYLGQSKTPSKTSTGEQLLSQSANVRQSNAQKNQFKPYIIKSEMKPISKTENVNTKAANITSDRKNYSVLNNTFTSGTGYETVRLKNNEIGNQKGQIIFNNGMYQIHNNINSSNINRVPQTTMHRVERIQGIRTLDVSTPNGAVNKNFNNEIRPFIYPFQQFRKK